VRRLPRSNIEYAPLCPGVFEGEDVGARYISNVDEVPGLPAILVDWDGQAVRDPVTKNGANSRVGVVEGLAWPIGHEVAKHGDRDLGVFSEEQSQTFLIVFADRIGGGRVDGHFFVRGDWLEIRAARWAEALPAAHTEVRHLPQRWMDHSVLL